MSAPFVLRSYRELLRLIARLPTVPERTDALTQARQGMRQNQSACEEEVADLHRQLVSKIQFLRMKVPRLRRDADKVGFAKYVVRDGKVVEGTGRTAGARAADGKGVGKQEAWEMHRKLMKRQYFGEDPPYFSEMM